MKFLPQLISDVLLIEPEIHLDSRGYFLETFRQDILEKKTGHEINFTQDDESMSSKGVLRGLHYQLPPFAQNKLVRVILGSVLDVVVDIRNSSPTFGNHLSIEINDENKRQLFIPKGFAHGFIVKSDYAILAYKTDNYYSKSHERGILFNDQTLAIDWNYPKKDIVISEKDKSHPNFSINNFYF
jgi:dTDP-4-dehydrorhamnose 3,5-epimerase